MRIVYLIFPRLLTASRRGIVWSRTFVKTNVAKQIIAVAEVVAETLQLGVVWGPARIGKTMTLEALVGAQAYGDPVLIRALTRARCARLPCVARSATAFKNSE